MNTCPAKCLTHAYAIIWDCVGKKGRQEDKKAGPYKVTVKSAKPVLALRVRFWHRYGTKNRKENIPF